MQLLDQDFFFVNSTGAPMEGGFKAEFVDSARLFIFESYCRLHRRLELK